MKVDHVTSGLKTGIRELQYPALTLVKHKPLKYISDLNKYLATAVKASWPSECSPY